MKDMLRYPNERNDPPIRAQEYEKNQKTHPDNVMRMGWEHNQIMKS